ncbi:MAG: F0F1 ATP synthase subunit B [Oscillospiraceae bacterium]
MGEATYMQFLSIDWTIVMQLGNTLILFLLMKKFFFKPVKDMIDSREKEVSDIYDNAQKVQTDAEEMKQKYEKSMSTAKSEANDIVNLACKRAQTRSDEIVKEAQDKSVIILQKAEEETKLEKKRAVNEIKGEISDMAMMIAQKIVEKDINANDHEQLIQQFIDGVGDKAWKE